MISKAFTVYDSKIGAYLAPFFMKSRGEALRAWMDIVNDEKSAFNKHPEDFTLFEVGEYDDEKGQFKNLLTPHSLGVATEVHRGYEHPGPTTDSDMKGVSRLLGATPSAQ